MKAPEDKKYYAYLLLCADSSIYSGYTINLKRRLAQHNQGKGAKYTRSRLPVELIYSEGFATKNQALKREAAFKRLSHKEKLQFIK